jgi:caffeoyl-CoA O-methyltransferase
MSDMYADGLERYAAEHTTPREDELAVVASDTTAHMPSPGMMTGLVEARLLQAFVVASGAKRVLEIGTFTGHGALSMAARLAPGGQIITIENDERMAAIARRNIDASPYAGVIELVVGDARALVESIEGPFDLVFLDAWKSDYPHYYGAVMPKLAERGILVADNVLQSGQVLDPAAADKQTIAMREFNDLVQQDPRVDNALLTVADGLLIAWRRG